MPTALQRNLRQQISNKKISIHALEKKAGLKPSAIQNILLGKSKRPAAELLLAIANELDCSVEDLIRETPPTRSLPSPKKWISELYMDALKTVQSILDEQKKELERNVVLKIVEEVYLYSIRGSLSRADKRFADWIISHH